MGVTANELAEYCGVSRTTVNRALGGTGRINLRTREKILRAAQELGYRPHMLARGLVKGETMNLGVVVFDIRNSYFAQMVSAIEQRAKEAGYAISVMLHEKDLSLERQIVERMVDYRMDGLILCPVGKGEAYARWLEEQPIPVVSVGNRISAGIPLIGVDERAAAAAAVRFLLGRGYDQIVYVCPPLHDAQHENIYSHERRYEGVCEAAAGACLEVVRTWEYIERIDALLADAPRGKTALFCSGDLFALDVMRHLKRRGVDVPGDVGVMGFDNIDMLSYFVPTLATVDCGIDRIGTCAVEALLNRIAGNEAAVPPLPHRILDGESIRNFSSS